jgi:hypothetical protein
MNLIQWSISVNRMLSPHGAVVCSRRAAQRACHGAHLGAERGVILGARFK